MAYFNLLNNLLIFLLFQLLDHEVYVEKQVSLLLTLDQGQSALIKAIESGDTDLVYAVIIDIQSKTSLSKFQVKLLFS